MQSIENRVVYGRLLPYSHSSDRWSPPKTITSIPSGKSRHRLSGSTCTSQVSTARTSYGN